MSLWIAAGEAEITPYMVQAITKMANSISDGQRLDFAFLPDAASLLSIVAPPINAEVSLTWTNLFLQGNQANGELRSH
jgi:hypothetical protein